MLKCELSVLLGMKSGNFYGKIFIYGKKPLKPTVSKQIELKCKEIFDCNKKSIERQKVIYRILGQKNEKTVMILPFYHIKN